MSFRQLSFQKAQLLDCASVLYETLRASGEHLLTLVNEKKGRGK